MGQESDYLLAMKEKQYLTQQNKSPKSMIEAEALLIMKQ
jgi:hypothetical protein